MLRNLASKLVTAAWLIILFPFACLAMLLTLDGGVSIWMARKLWSPVLLWVGGIRLVVHGRQNADPRRPTIYVSNHQSTADIPALFVALGVNFRFVAKNELKYVPFLGWYLYLAGHVFVDRGNRRAAIASLDRAAQKIRSGTSILVFPEGTRSPDGRILPFKKGPFALALKARVPICPVTIEGSGRVMPKNTWKITPGEVHVMIGEPIDTAAFAEDDRERLIRVVRDRIIEQSLRLGGKGGDSSDAVAAQGREGVGEAVSDREVHAR